MNSSTDNAWKITPTTASDSLTASSLCDWMNSWTRPSGSLNSSITSCGSMLDPKLSLRKLTVSVMYASDSDNRSATWVPTSVPTAPAKIRNAISTPNRIRIVARPRRQPRAASRLTPGSIASDRKTDTSNSTSSDDNRWNTWRPVMVSR